MDEKDDRIIQILKANSRVKYVKIAQILGLSEGAVRRRVKRMVEQATIRRFTIETKPEAEGIILVKTEPDKTKHIALKMKAISDKVFELSGDYDVAAVIQAQTIDGLNRKIDSIRRLPFILNTNTLIKLVSD